MASPTGWTWVWASPGSWWWTGRPGVLQSMGSQSQTQLTDWTKNGKSQIHALAKCVPTKNSSAHSTCYSSPEFTSAQEAAALITADEAEGKRCLPWRRAGCCHIHRHSRWFNWTNPLGLTTLSKMTHYLKKGDGLTTMVSQEHTDVHQGGRQSTENLTLEILDVSG